MEDERCDTNAKRAGETENPAADSACKGIILIFANDVRDVRCDMKRKRAKKFGALTALVAIEVSEALPSLFHKT